MTCKLCGGEYPDIFFESKGVGGVYSPKIYRSTICRGCLQTKRDTKKAKNRPLQKARDAYKHHAQKFIERGIITHRDELRTAFGWNLNQMSHDIKHASKNGCRYCEQLFSKMAHGLASVTLDIINPEDPPFYQTNVAWVCRTCNTEKQRTPPAVWGQILQCYRRWREIQREKESDPYFGMPLFEGVEL